jgi:hypothetical protein
MVSQTKAEGASVIFTTVSESEHIYDSIKTDAQDWESKRHPQGVISAILKISQCSPLLRAD